MAKYSSLKLTNQGLDLLAKVQAGGTDLTFTRFGMGNGTFYFPGDVPTMTALVNEKMTRPVLNVVKLDQGSAEISTIIADVDLPVIGFDMSEIGLFATDPDLGEILYGVVYAGATADFIPASADGMAYDYAINLIVTVNDSATITVIVDSATAATKGELSAHAALVVDPTQTGADKKHLTNDQAKKWEDHGNDSDKHVTAAQKTAWDDHKADSDQHVTAGQKTAWDGHKGDTNNPHGTNAEGVGLGNLPNAKSNSVSLDSDLTLATSKAAKTINDALTIHKNTSANESQRGHVELSTDGEAAIGTDLGKAVHPQGLKYAIDVRHKYIASRSTSGTWTILGLRAGLPLHLGLAKTSGASEVQVPIKVLNGANIGLASSGWFAFRTDLSTNGTSPSMTTIPVSTSIEVSISSIPTGCVLYAYQ